MEPMAVKRVTLSHTVIQLRIIPCGSGELLRVQQEVRIDMIEDPIATELAKWCVRLGFAMLLIAGITVLGWFFYPLLSGQWEGFGG